MMAIVCSCGHEVDDLDHTYNVLIKATDRSGEKALSYLTVCGPCEDRYRQVGYIFDDHEEGFSWLEKEQW